MPVEPDVAVPLLCAACTERPSALQAPKSPMAMPPVPQDGTISIAMVADARRWAKELLSGAGLKATNLTKSYDKSVYKHYQDEASGHPELDDDLFDDDDHQSPCQPARYIVLRIEPMMEFYTGRVPIYVRHGFK